MDPLTDEYRVILNQQDLLQVTPRLLLDPGRAAVCRVRERDTLEGREFILDRWEITSPFPSGQQRPPMTTWAVMLADDSPSLDSLIKRLSPKRSQRVILLQLNRKDHAKLTLSAWLDGQWSSPSEVSLVGSGMLTLKSSDRLMADENSSDQSIRASRTRDALPRNAFEKVRHAQVAMVGAGGGGIALAGTLVSIGVLKLTMIDSDRLGPENLDRMPWVRHQSIGTFNSRLTLLDPVGHRRRTSTEQSPRCPVLVCRLEFSSISHIPACKGARDDSYRSREFDRLGGEHSSLVG
jgi:hypothetical protein